MDPPLRPKTDYFGLDTSWFEIDIFLQSVFEPRDFALEWHHHWYTFTICIAQYKNWFFWRGSSWNYIGRCRLSFAIPFVTWASSRAVFLQLFFYNYLSYESVTSGIKIPHLARAINLLAFECIQTCCFTFRFILTLINTPTQWRTIDIDATVPLRVRIKILANVKLYFSFTWGIKFD